MPNINELIQELIEYAKGCGLIALEDEEYAVNRLLYLFKLSDYKKENVSKERELSEILSDMCDFAHGCGLGRLVVGDCEYRISPVLVRLFHFRRRKVTVRNYTVRM